MKNLPARNFSLVLICFLFSTGREAKAEEKQKEADFDLVALARKLETAHTSLHVEARKRDFMKALPAVDAKSFPQFLAQTASLKEEGDIRLAAQSALIEKFAESDAASATEAAVKLLVNAIGDPARWTLNGSLKVAAQRWAKKQPGPALEWLHVLATKGDLDRKNLVKAAANLRSSLVAGALTADRTMAVIELRKLKENEAAEALAIYASEVNDEAARAFFLEQVARLSAQKREKPLCAYTAALYAAGKSADAARLVKEQGTDDDCRAAMVLAAVTKTPGSSVEKAALIHVPWLRANTPPSLIGRNLGRFFAYYIFFPDEIDSTVTLLRAAAKENEIDAALSEFCTEPSLSMGNEAAAFLLAQSIKDSVLRLPTLKKVMENWAEDSPAKAGAALADAKSLSKEENAALRLIVHEKQRSRGLTQEQEDAEEADEVKRFRRRNGGSD